MPGAARLQISSISVLIAVVLVTTVVSLSPPLDAQSASPGPRSGALMVYDGARKQSVLFGGERPAASGQGMDYPDDLWAWNGESWRRLDPPSGTPRPSGRESPHLAYDAARDRIMLFAGRRRPDLLNDVWEWDGTRWHEIANAGLDRTQHAATIYDPRRRRVVMYGPNYQSRQLWEWDGGKWNLIDGAAPEGIGLELAALAGGELILLVRGPLAETRPPAQAWAWTGTTWQQREAGPAWANLQASTSTPDGTIYFYQSWERGLTEPVMHKRDASGVWTQLPIAVNPGVRYTEAAAWDSARQRMVIYGGRTRDNQFLSDTWEFDGRVWAKR